MIATYPHHRVRGLAPWRPQKATLAVISQIQAVLAEYEDHLPLTCRQIFYRLVGAHGFAKTEDDYKRLLEILNRARRSGQIAFEAIRDDGTTANLPGGFTDQADFWATCLEAAEEYRRDRLDGQPHWIEVWVEAAGMVPQIARVVHLYGVGVYSSGGFDSLSAKWEAAQRIVARPQPTLVLHIGDYDPSGVSIFDSAEADVTQLVADQAEDPGAVTFQRVAVTPEQIARYGLPEAPPKARDRRGDWTGGTVQAEALPPAVLAREVKEALRARLNLSTLRDLMEIEARDRDALLGSFPSF
jgi:hypothetical protein